MPIWLLKISFVRDIFRSLRIGATRSRFLTFTIAPNRSLMQSIRFDSEVGKHKPRRFAKSTQGKMRIEPVESTRFRFLSNSVEPLASLVVIKTQFTATSLSIGSFRWGNP
jgi:hypothetical protein